MHETLLFSHTSVAELPESLAERWVVVAGDSIAYPSLQRCFAFFQMMVWTNVCACACARRHYSCSSPSMGMTVFARSVLFRH